MEIQALEGGQRWTAKAMHERFGLLIFVGSASGELTEIHDLSQLDQLKKVRRKGYDFFTSSSPFWIDFMVGGGAN